MTLHPFSAVAKVNIFLKVTGTRGAYHEIISRFMRIDTLYDTLIFEPKTNATPFEIRGNFTCKLEDNTIYKAYCALMQQKPSTYLQDFFTAHRVVVDKRIPAYAGLGGGSSDAATFLLMCNEILQLNLCKEELCTIGLGVGSDVPFFISEYASANVSGIGDIVVPYEETPLHLEIVTPDIEISTPRVYETYRNHFFHPITTMEAEQWAQRSSKETLEHYTISEANDLFLPACQAYPSLKIEAKSSYFFSGSGSSFFRIADHG